MVRYLRYGTRYLRYQVPWYLYRGTPTRDSAMTSVAYHDWLYTRRNAIFWDLA